MVSLKDIFKGSRTGFPQNQRNQSLFAPPKHYSPEEFVIHEQEESGERWHGVPLSELSMMAQETYRGKYVKVDRSGVLEFYYSSNSRKTEQVAQYELGEDGLLKMLPHHYYSGQWRDSSNEFAEKANQHFTFR